MTGSLRDEGHLADEMKNDSHFDSMKNGNT